MNHSIQSTAFIIMGIFICCALLFTMLMIILNYSKKVRQKDKTYLKALMEDRERIYQQLATELHDNIANLAATAIVLNNRLAERPEADNSVTINDLKSVLHRLHIDAHNMSRGFVSPHVAELELKEIMEQELLRLQRTTGVQTSFKRNGFVKRIPDFKKVMLYRIFQEALMNSLKHAAAQSLSVELCYHEDDSFEMNIRDDGRGFDRDDQDFREGIGISSMQERATLLKGRLSITAVKGSGTNIRFLAKRFWNKDDGSRDQALINWHFKKPPARPTIIE